MSSPKEHVGNTLQSEFPTPEDWALWSGLEDRKEDLSNAMLVVLRTLQIKEPYLHNINSPLIMAHLMAMQYAKQNGGLAKLVEFDVRTMEPLTKRIGQMVRDSGNPEYALVGLFDRPICHFGLALDTKVEPGRRTWTSPFKADLEAAQRLGQFDLTEQEVHEQWTTPRLLGYAKGIGVALNVSPWRDDGVITCELANKSASRLEVV